LNHGGIIVTAKYTDLFPTSPFVYNLANDIYVLCTATAICSELVDTIDYSLAVMDKILPRRTQRTLDRVSAHAASSAAFESELDEERKSIPPPSRDAKALRCSTRRTSGFSERIRVAPNDKPCKMNRGV